MNTTTATFIRLLQSIEATWQDADSSLCLTAVGAIEQVPCDDAQRLAGEPHKRGGGRVDQGRDWLPRRQGCGASTADARLRGPQAGDWLDRWAMNLLIIVSTRSASHRDSMSHGDACFTYFNKIWGIPGRV